MRKFPDVLGLELQEALACMEDVGQPVQVCCTRPDRGGPAEGAEHVIRQKWDGDRWTFTVSQVPDAYGENH